MRAHVHKNDINNVIYSHSYRVPSNELTLTSAPNWRSNFAASTRPLTQASCKAV